MHSYILKNLYLKIDLNFEEKLKLRNCIVINNQNFKSPIIQLLYSLGLLSKILQ